MDSIFGRFSNLLEPGKRDSMRICLFENGLRMGHAIIAIPEGMANAVATLDLNHRASRTVAPALAAALVADTASAN